MIADISPKRSRRLSGYEIDKISKYSLPNEENRQRIALETLEEIEFCLDRLESMLTHPSASQLAAHKFRQILKQEISQDPEFNTRSSNSITNYLRTFLEEENNEDHFTESKSKNKGSKEKLNKEKTNRDNKVKDINKKISSIKGHSYKRIKSSSIESLSRIPYPVDIQSENGGKNAKPPNNNKSKLNINNNKKLNNSNNKLDVNTVNESSDNNNTNDDKTKSNNNNITTPNNTNNDNDDSCFTSGPALELEAFRESVKPELQELIERTDNTWGVDLFKLASLSDNFPLTHVSMHLFKQRNLLQTFQMDERVFYNYWSRVEQHYHSNNPYHNNTHATDVLQATHYMLNFPSFKDVFSDLEVFAAMFAAGVHDVDHPGVTNQFLINTDSDLAILYNDESVLENHHVTLAFQLLGNNNNNNNKYNNNNYNNIISNNVNNTRANNQNSNFDCDILASLNRRQRQHFRKMVIAMVLGTDMSKHLKHVATLKTMVEMRRLSTSSLSPSPTNPLPIAVIDPDNAEDKLHILECLIHCSDLSNPLKPLPLYSQWTDKIMEEFFRQGDQERELELEISPLCDRNVANVCKSQMGFIDYVVYPLWEFWALLTQPHCQPIIDILDSNRAWVTDQANQAANSSPGNGSSGSDSDASSSGSETPKCLEEKKD